MRLRRARVTSIRLIEMIIISHLHKLHTAVVYRYNYIMDNAILQGQRVKGLCQGLGGAFSQCE